MIEFHTLGRLDLRRAGDDGGGSTEPDPSDLLTQSKPTALLTYLLLGRSRGMHRRDALVAMFWPELDHKRSRAALSQALYLLRKSLGSQVLESRGVEEIGVAAETIWCDALEFRAALDEDRLEDALALYGGELLPGFFTSEAIGFERWLDGERMELSHLAAEAPWHRAARREESGNAAAAGHWARRAVKLRPYDESAVQRLMETLARLGDRSGALRAYEVFRVRSIEELEIEPSDATEELAGRIRASAAGPMRDPASIEPTVRDDATPHRLATAPPAPTDGPAQTETPVPGGRIGADSGRSRSGWWRPVAWAVAVAFTLIAGVVVLEILDGTGPSTAAGAAGRQIVVLPIEAVGEADAERARMMTIRLIDDLARAGFQMPSYAAIAGFTDSLPSLYRSEDGPEWLVEGTLYQTEGLNELSIRIVDPRSNVQVWALPFREGGRSASEFALHLARTTADQLAQRMGIDPASISVPSLTDDPVVDSLYARGRYIFDTNYSWQGNELAAQAFRAAIDRDSSFVPAYAGLAIALHEQARVFWNPPPREVMPEVERLLTTALKLDPTYARTHSLLGWVAYTWHWDWAAAEQHYRTALELDPLERDTYEDYAFLLLATGRREEGLEIGRRAAELAPFSPLAVSTYAWHLWLANRLEESREVAGRVLRELDPGYQVAGSMYRISGFLLASPERRTQLASEAPPARHDTLVALEVGRASTFGLAGDTARALEIIAWEKTRPGVRPFRIANGYIWAGQADSAFAWLEKAIEARDPYLPEIAIRPWTIPYYDDPRFADVLERLNLPPWDPKDRPYRLAPGVDPLWPERAAGG